MITVVERHQGRRPADGDRPSNEIPYFAIVDEGEEEEEVLAAIRATAPTSLGGLVLVQCQVTERLSDAMYLGAATYGSASSQKETGESSFSFDTTGGTFHTTQSKQNVLRRAAGGGTAPDLGGTIGATADGDPAGVDITVPQYAFSETHYLADEDVTDTYKGALFALTGKVANATFKGCQVGECLFLGARGGQRGRGDWEITFSFAASPNVTGLTIGDVTGIAKKGWEYLWVRYQMEPVGAGAAKGLAPVPKAVYVERVYDLGNFALLGIGTLG